MKTCSKCHIEKPLSDFHKNSRSKDGFAYYCKACNTKRVLDHRANNVEAYRAYQARYAKDKSAEAGARARLWRENNQGRKTERNAARRALTKQATPSWANKDVVRGMYELASVFRRCGLDMQVDHIVPLKGKSVCGLHCEYNLRLSIGVENNAKRNRWDDATKSQLNFMG